MMNTCFLAVEGLLSTFQGDDYIHPQNCCCNSVLTRNLNWKESECLQMWKRPLHTTFISVFDQPFLLLVCMFHFFVHSRLSLPFCIFLLPGSWFLTWGFFLKKRSSQFHLFLVCLNLWVWRFLNAHENEFFFELWWGSFADSKQEPKRKYQCLWATVNKLVKKNDCD